MDKISQDFIIKQYQSGIESYANFTLEVGLWESEKYVFQKYLDPENRILDLGCGTGRTTIPLYQLGYQKIYGVDLTPEMINKANELNLQYHLSLDFQVGDATNLSFEDQTFDAVIFSFNGLMSIPEAESRLQAILEINRVLKPDGHFIFTTHDRDAAFEYKDFWKAEKIKWDAGQQDPSLYEFGDIISHSKNESREIFIHIPDKKEIETLLNETGFVILETFYRSHKFDEPEPVKQKSGECRFWIAKKL
ncbi:MAG: methyltransferase domain-containing protein [Bacteroidota bacterium]